MDWQPFPKVELHLHVDTSLSYEGVAQLDPSVTREEYQRSFAGREECADLADFLTGVPRLISLQQTERGLQMLIQDMFRQLAADNMLYAELRFAPLQHLQQGLTPTEVVRIVEAETERAARDSGIEARLILCSLRHFSADQSMETVQLIDQFRGSRVVGFDLAGDEAGYPLTTHLEAFRLAADRHIPITSHAGEGAGAESVWETLELINPPRIGHGVHSVSDPALVKVLKDRRTHLEMCPTCNVQLKVFPSYAEHCIDKFHREGLSLGISSDNRTLTPITLTREYEKLEKTFGWTKADFLTCNLDTLEAAFLPDTRRQELRRELIERYEAL
ncbi:MAG: adenosine deaminase [Anaerolineae bacterium]|nr:adenosine deaminase [Anaerolineae bacterium]